MVLITAIVACTALSLLFYVHLKGGDAKAVFTDGTFSTLEILPILLFALIAASALEHIIPEEWIVQWLGKESGFKGLMIGSFAGMLCPPGGAVVIYGIVGGLLKAGAGVGTIVALLTSYNLLALHRFPFEISMLGWKFLMLRIASVLICAPVAGIIAQSLARLWHTRLG